MSLEKIMCLNFVGELTLKCDRKSREGWWRQIKSILHTISYKLFETNSSFHLNSALREKFNFYFSRDFC